MHHLRKPDFRKGKKLGLFDHIVTWTRPKEGTLHLEPELYAQLPETILVREIRYCITIKGYRTRHLKTTMNMEHIQSKTPFVPSFILSQILLLPDGAKCNIPVF